jgi:hypothetical protein
MVQQDENRNDFRNRVILGGIGLAAGTVHFALYDTYKPAVQVGTEDAYDTIQWYLAMMFQSSALVALLVFRPSSWGWDILFSLGVGVFTAVLFKVSATTLGFLYSDLDNLSGAIFLSLFVTFLLILATSLPFYQAARTEGRLSFPYRLLFSNAWTNKLVGIVAAVFLGIVWLVLALWGGLFNLVDVAFFSDLFTETWFIWTFSGAMFGLGVALARERQAVTDALLKLILTLFRVLAPILAFVILLFLATLVFTGIEPLWDTKMAAAILLLSLGLLVLFQNAVIQDAESAQTFWKPAEWIVMAANVAAPALPILAGWGIYLRVDQYGWTPARFFMVLLTGVALAYALTYAGSILVKRSAWTEGIIRCNPILALALLALAVFMHVPPLEPYGRSASDQLSRLRDGRTAPADFDFSYLKFKLGNAGQDALRDIESDLALMKNIAVRETLETIKSHTGYVSPQSYAMISKDSLADVTTYLDVFPPDEALSSDTIRAWIDQYENSFKGCFQWSRAQETNYSGKTATLETNKRCAVIMGDVNGDGLRDAVFFFGGSSLKTLVRINSNIWKTGRYLRTDSANVERVDLMAAIRRGEVQFLPPAVRDVKIGGVRFE